MNGFILTDVFSLVGRKKYYKNHFEGIIWYGKIFAMKTMVNDDLQHTDGLSLNYLRG